MSREWIEISSTNDTQMQSLFINLSMRDLSYWRNDVSNISNKLKSSLDNIYIYIYVSLYKIIIRISRFDRIVQEKNE